MSQTVDIRELNERIESKSSFVNMITMGMDKVIVGQKHLVESLLIGLLFPCHSLFLFLEFVSAPTSGRSAPGVTS